MDTAVRTLCQIVEHSMYAKKLPDKRDIKIVSMLAHRIEKITEPNNRAAIVTILAQYSQGDAENTPGEFTGVARYAPDVVRLVVRKWEGEASSSLDDLLFSRLLTFKFLLPPSFSTIVGRRQVCMPRCPR